MHKIVYLWDTNLIIYCFGYLCGFAVPLQIKILIMPSNESSGSDSDSDLQEDMEALKRARSLAGAGVDDDLPESSSADVDYDATSESEDEDMELLRSIEQRFSVPINYIGTEQEHKSTKPLQSILPSGLSDESDDYGDDFETLRAIQRRFSQYYGIVRFQFLDFVLANYVLLCKFFLLLSY